MARITPSLENRKTSFVDILNENENGFGSTEFIAFREKDKIYDKHFIYYLVLERKLITSFFHKILFKFLYKKELKLRELAVILTERVKANASIDWTIKESVRAKLKVIIKRTLRQFGYPPDMQKLATETVLKQAELIANELTE
ncbi:MAG: DUF3387 domain-containing protein [Bacteroidales bacterium]|nr:DUF3387 domain-containing protein [Bacteroidales bacterium]